MGVQVSSVRSRVRPGLEVFLAERPSWAAGRRFGLLCHQAAVDSALRPATDLISAAFPHQLRCLFSPQHGLYAQKQDNMVESPNEFDARVGAPVFSLYGATREPSSGQLEGIDLLLVDLQDVGCRVYTYIWTLYLALRACSRAGVAVAVLDRPNPLGGLAVEGNLVSDDCRSFVGLAPLPMRHGMTIGEIARFLVRHEGLDVELHVVPMHGWRRHMDFDATGLPWVWPSPNMPTLETARVYPGQVIWEGTNVSEGRGTTRPFEVFGAPYFETEAVRCAVGQWGLSGFVLREQSFEPTFHKWAGRTCHGFQIHVIDGVLYQPYLTSLSLLSALLRLYPEEVAWRDPPYEYEFERQPIDLILGDRRVRAAVEAGAAPAEFEDLWADDLASFCAQRASDLLYPEDS